MAKNKLKPFMAMILLMAGALFTWAFYRFMYTLIGDLLMSFGIVNDYWQNGIILAITGAILYFIGKKNLKDLVK